MINRIKANKKNYATINKTATLKLFENNNAKN